MNIVDFFWIWGPTGIWLLAISIFFSAAIYLINTHKIISELSKTTAELRRGATELQKITSELRVDTNELRTGTNELKKELCITRHSIDTFENTLRKVYSAFFWWSSTTNER